MRRLPGILLLTGAALVVIAALLVSGLRIALPHLDAWRPEILNKIESATGMPVEASQLSASWQNFGPTLEAHDIRAELKDGGEFSVKRVTLALDVWQSLLHMRWQFRDLTFWQLRFRTNTPITSGGSDDSLEASHISDLFLRQFCKIPTDRTTRWWLGYYFTYPMDFWVQQGSKRQNPQELT